MVTKVTFEPKNKKARAELSEFRGVSGFSPSVSAKLRRHGREEMQRKIRLYRSGVVGGDRYRKSNKKPDEALMKISFGEHSDNVDAGSTGNDCSVKWHFEPTVLPAYEMNAKRYRRVEFPVEPDLAGRNRSSVAGVALASSLVTRNTLDRESVNVPFSVHHSGADTDLRGVETAQS